MSTVKASPSVAILLATQRSGTHLIKGALDTHPEIAAPFGEIFHDGDENKLNFFRYMLERAQTDPRCVLPHQRLTLFAEYLKVVPAICEKPHVVVDIKYNSVHHVHTVWQTAVQTPPLFELIHENNYPVIHLLRKNLLKTVISNIRAQKLEQYHRAYGEAPITAKIHIDPQFVLECLNILKALHGWIAQAITYCPRVLTIYYEDLLRQSAGEAGNETLLNPEPLKQIAALFNVEPNFTLQPRTKKVTPSDLRLVIVNYDELHGALAGTEYAQYLD